MKNPRVSRRIEILKICRNKCKRNKETIAKINKAKSCFFEKVNKVDRPLAKLIKKKRTKSTKLEMKMERSQQRTLKYKGS